jgi:hypothetical protein
LARHHRADEHRHSWLAHHQGAAPQPTSVDTGERWLLGPPMHLLRTDRGPLRLIRSPAVLRRHRAGPIAPVATSSTAN